MFEVDKFEELVCSVIRESGAHAMTREEIIERLMDDLRAEMSKKIIPTLDRLAGKGIIEVDRDSSPGRPYIYWVRIRRRI